MKRIIPFEWSVRPHFLRSSFYVRPASTFSLLLSYFHQPYIEPDTCSQQLGQLGEIYCITQVSNWNTSRFGCQYFLTFSLTASLLILVLEHKSLLLPFNILISSLSLTHMSSCNCIVLVSIITIVMTCNNERCIPEDYT